MVLSITWASFGSSSVNCTPGSLVAMGLKTLLHLVGHVVLGVPQVEVAGAALQVKRG